jgi:RHS repeat-associated protein
MEQKNKTASAKKASSKLLAEYQPVIAKYYYYTSDQINSTRIITNSSGTVVYSALFDPYGGMQKQWVNTYSPSLKFSGKERETRSEMDYFGARYYDHLRYRFISVDPVINKEEALGNPQLWNLYAYCGNNPISCFDPDGKELRTTCLTTMQEIAGGAASRISITGGVLNVSQLTPSDISGNEGASLLNQLATDSNIYAYSEGSSIATAAGIRPLNGGVENLDINPDWRTMGNPKTPSNLPSGGIADIIGINPSISYTDSATGTLSVARAAIAFHELAEAYGKINLGMPYIQKGGGPGAHDYAKRREQTLIAQRPNFTQFPAGEELKRR